MNSTAARSLRQMASFLEYLTERPSELPLPKLNKQKILALKLIVRAWKRLARETSEDMDALASEIGASSGVLSDNLKNEDGGRPLGAKSKSTADSDAIVLADIARGVKKHIALRRQYPGATSSGKEAKRINRALLKIEAENRRIIALQTRDIKPL